LGGTDEAVGEIGPLAGVRGPEGNGAPLAGRVLMATGGVLAGNCAFRPCETDTGASDDGADELRPSTKTNLLLWAREVRSRPCINKCMSTEG